MISKEIVSFRYAESQSQKHLIVAIKRFSSTDLYELMCTSKRTLFTLLRWKARGSVVVVLYDAGPGFCSLFFFFISKRSKADISFDSPVLLVLTRRNFSIATCLRMFIFCPVSVILFPVASKSSLILNLQRTNNRLNALQQI